MPDILVSSSEITGVITNTDVRLSDARTPTAHSHAEADVTGLTAALNAKEATANKGAVNGYAPLGADSKVPAANLPAGGAG